MISTSPSLTSRRPRRRGGQGPPLRRGAQVIRSGGWGLFLATGGDLLVATDSPGDPADRAAPRAQSAAQSTAPPGAGPSREAGSTAALPQGDEPELRLPQARLVGGL